MAENEEDQNKVEEKQKKHREKVEMTDEFPDVEDIFKKEGELPSATEAFEKLKSEINTLKSVFELYTKPIRWSSETYLPSKSVKDKIKKETNIGKLRSDLRERQKTVSIIDTKILIVETFLKFIPLAAATLLITSTFYGLQAPNVDVPKLIFIITAFMAILILLFLFCYDIRCRYGDKSYEVNTEINESFKQIERLIHKKAYDEIVLNDSQQKILRFLLNPQIDRSISLDTGASGYEITDVTKYLNLDPKQTELDIASLVDYGLISNIIGLINITGKGINYMRQ